MRKTILIICLVVLIAAAVVFYLRFVVGGPEDDWICEDGKWVKHGAPSAPKPTSGCEKEAKVDKITPDTAKTEGVLDESMFQWSTMSEGPYRDKVTYATSTDLINWTPSGVILAEHASVPGALYQDGTIFVYFVDVTQNGQPEQLGFVSSSDNGLTWSEQRTLTIKGIGNRAVADPAPFQLDDGRIRLYYFDINEPRLNLGSQGQEPPQKIYSLISSDGLNFTQEDGVRFQRDGAFDPDVEKIGDIYRMYVGDLAGNKVVSATSTDSLTFVEEGTAYQGGAVPDVFYDNGTYYLFTAGIDMATSSDGKQFTASGHHFSDPNYRITADPSVVQLDDGTFLMLYKVQP